MAPAPGHLVDDSDGAMRGGHEGVDQCGLSHARVPHGHRDVPHEQLGQFGQRWVVRPTRHHGNAEPHKVGQEIRGVGEVCLGHAQDGGDAGVVGGHEVTINQTHARLGVGGGRDDEHLVGVGNDYALHGIGVIGTAPQDARALVNSHDARERTVVTGRIAHECHTVAGDQGVFAQFARACGGHGVSARPVRIHQHGVTTPIDRNHHAVDGSLVGGAILGARSRALAVGAHPNVGFVVTGFLTVIRQPRHALGLALSSETEHVHPQLGKLGQGLGRRANVFDVDAGDAKPDDGAGRGHAVVFVGVPQAAVERCGFHTDSVGQLDGAPAETVDLGNQSRQSICLVVANVTNARDFTRAVG